MTKVFMWLSKRSTQIKFKIKEINISRMIKEKRNMSYSSFIDRLSRNNTTLLWTNSVTPCEQFMNG